ncbi:hypothetical protein DRN46_02570 [Thermococci archaeon]|nr:MAG: hypothetical protein DRN46_02570 [Thermococci archaeon]
MFYIVEEALDFILGASRSAYPREFAGLLSGDKEKKIIKEVLFLPGTEVSGTSAYIRTDMLPLDPSVLGSVHSHPGRSARPSESDLRFFSKFGVIHIITRYPYSGMEDVFAYNRKGERMHLEVISEKDIF